MELRIKGMVCQHCVEALSRLLREAGLEVESVEIGRAVISRTLDDSELKMLDSLLAGIGFSRAKTADEMMVERIRQTVIEHVRHPEECRLNLSSCLEEHLNTPYDTLSRVFSATEGRTIEKYCIAQRVEWVKELLSYGEKTIAEIADITGYSSAAHLTRQFKSVTGLTPTAFLLHPTPRRSLAEV